MMKKNQQQHQKLFEKIESDLFDDLMSRRPLEDREKSILDELSARPKKGGYLQTVQKELERIGAFLQPGQKYPIMARNTTKAKVGRRFVYLGEDGVAYIGRLGKPFKVRPAKI